MNSSTPLITVMVLCYNYGHLLHRALEAIGAQSFSDYELLFIDNGSTDNSKQVFEEFCQKHPELNTRYMLVSPNQGPTHGWNMGLQQAHGEYVMFHDADDWMEPNCLEVLGNAARETGADRITGQYQEALPDGTVQRVRHLAVNKKSCIVTPMMQGVIFKREIIQQNGIILPENMVGPYDAYMTFRFAAVEKTVPVFIKTTVYNYMINPDSICRTYEKAQKTSSDELVMYQKFHRPLIDAAEWCIPYISQKDVYQQMEYLTLRNSYAAIVAGYRIYSINTANLIYSMLSKDLERVFPEYKKNPYINPIGNGFELAGSLAVWGLIMADRIGILHLVMKLYSIIARASGKV